MPKLSPAQIITHRGLEPTKNNIFSESSFEAFSNHLSRGFGIEFDPIFTLDGIVISHDSTLDRITKGEDKRLFAEITSDQAIAVPLENGRLCTLDDLFDLIQKNSTAINALHLKGKFQQLDYIDSLLEHFTQYSDILCRIIIFDVKPEIASYMKNKNSKLILAPSVAHPYDISRYNSAVLGTLISLEEAIKMRDIYDWVWLDEWDRTNENHSDKTFYNKKVFQQLKAAKYKIALVTPELHGTSPGLLGGESHPDAQPKEILFKRINEIIDLNPDAICTDYPEEVLKL